MSGTEFEVTAEPVIGSGRVVAILPPEIDLTNADVIADQLVRMAVADRGVRVVVADLSRTTFCDSRGVHQLLMACRHAGARGVELRLAAPREPVIRVFELTGVSALVRLYPDVPAALAAEAARPVAEQP
ncbi:MAG: STAS domain-containing protein [Streptosporangiaceae bacterium]|nr:STAS domain-containing protein [Streptosporangiaceae bacterium]MBV9853545.1 STAS domain-containing protein [Streptosporangiaceae bacterium]